MTSKVEYTHLVASRDHTSSLSLLHQYPVIRASSLNIDGSLAISPKLISSAYLLHKKKSFDLIHLHFPDPMSHLASFALPNNIPRIITWHADITRQKTLLKIYRPFLKNALTKASAIILPTPAHMTKSPELSQLNTKNHYHIIPFGFKLDQFLKPHPNVSNITQQFSGKLIFALGRHVYYKGFNILIKALRQIESPTQLLIGGIGPLTESWKALAITEGVDDRVHFLGLISEKELPAYYQACDIFCLPATSPAEAFGIVQVEAMAAGKPIVSTRLNNGVDFVNQHGITGLTVEPNNVDDLASALNQLLANHNLRQQLGEQARHRALTDFSLEAMGEKTFDLYKKVIDTHKK